MLRSALIFLAAILLPSLALAWLAVRSAQDQQVLLEHQQAIISQDVTDNLALNVNQQIDGVRAEFVQVTQDLLNKNPSPQAAAADFDTVLRSQWPPAEVGFAVDLRGNIYSPTSNGGPAARTFREENGRFLSNRENVEVYSSLNSQNLVARQLNKASNNFNVIGGGNGITSNGTVTNFTASNGTTTNATHAISNQNSVNLTFGGSGTAATTSGITGGIGGATIAGDDQAGLSGGVFRDESNQTQTKMATGSGALDLLQKPASQTQEKTRTKIVAGELPDSAASASPVTTPLNADATLPQVTVAPTQEAKLTKKLPSAARRNEVAKADSSKAQGKSLFGNVPQSPQAASPSPLYDATAKNAPAASVSVAATAAAPVDAASTPPPVTTAPEAQQDLPQLDSSTTTVTTGVKRPLMDQDGSQTEITSGSTLQGPLAYTGNTTITGGTLKISQIARQVMPQNADKSATAIFSNTVPEESDFRRLIGNDTSGSGALARFLDNKLQLMIWFRPSTTSDLVFGAQLNQAKLLDRLRTVVETQEETGKLGSLMSSRTANYCVALLDDTGHPVALSIPGFTADWKHPFVATEIGETLPHWEAALYLTDPKQMSKSAHTLQLTLGLIVLLLVVAIVSGGSLIAADIRRKVLLAQQKTDFVSNVSHELKTPLTSIRMFADLLAEGRVTEPERQLTYLKIISAESARLTRLINNVLDFARQERGAPGGERRPCDLVETTRDVVETCLPHLEANGQNLTCEIEAETLPIVGDRDALAQIVLNLISNAEKYGGGEIVVRIRRQQTAAGSLGCVDVLDRGPGIPPKQVEAIFLPFHRLHDSLSNGIPGSGLGLTLARRMARVHGGDISYTPRAGGGSCFTLAVPLTS